MLLTLNERQYSELSTAILSVCQLFVLVQRCSSPGGNVGMLASVISMHSSSEITAQGIDDASGTIKNGNDSKTAITGSDW